MDGSLSNRVKCVVNARRVAGITTVLKNSSDAPEGKDREASANAILVRNQMQLVRLHCDAQN